MIPHADMLVQKHTLSPNNPRTVQLPNGTTTHITHTGSSSLTKHDTLNNVLLIPEFKFNLLSVSKMTKDLQCVVSFFPDFVVIQDLSSGQMKVIGKEHAGLYHLPSHTHSTNTQCQSHLVHTAAASSSTDSQI